MSSKTFLTKARNWASKNQIFGPQGFLKFVMLSYVEALSKITDEFIFKGGNLLWMYIKTPRATIDIDFATKNLNSHDLVYAALLEAGNQVEGISFMIKSFEEVLQEGKLGASVTISFTTDQEASNQFQLDVVYASHTKITQLHSLINPQIEINVATLENIIFEKILTCYQFGSGNTRMKDYDDLWRISKSKLTINFKEVIQRLKAQNISLEIKKEWFNQDLLRSWENHSKRYKDLPQDLNLLFDDVNSWLSDNS